MDNKSVVSCYDLIKNMNEKTINTKTIKTCGETIEVTQVISIDKFEELVSRIVAMCFNEDDEYLPEARDFVTRLGIVFAYTDVTFPESLSDIIGDLYMLMYSTDFYDSVKKAADSAQLEEVLTAVDYRIGAKVKENTSFVGIAKKFLSDVTTQFNNVFSEGNMEMLGEFVDKIGSGDIDADKILEMFADKLVSDVNEVSGE